MSSYENIDGYLEIDDEEINVVFGFDYQPFEAATRNHPGANEEYTITSVHNEDKSELLLSDLKDVHIEHLVRQATRWLESKMEASEDDIERCEDDRYNSHQGI